MLVTNLFYDLLTRSGILITFFLVNPSSLNPWQICTKLISWGPLMVRTKSSFCATSTPFSPLLSWQSITWAGETESLPSVFQISTFPIKYYKKGLEMLWVLFGLGSGDIMTPNCMVVGFTSTYTISAYDYGFNFQFSSLSVTYEKSVFFSEYTPFQESVHVVVTI